MYKAYLIGLTSPNLSKSPYQEKLTTIINKKTIRYHLNKLIREYNILPKERTPLIVVKHVLKTLFWATVYSAFSFLTISSTYNVIQQYCDDEVTTNMKAIINNNITYLPNMTICFKINVLELFNINSTSSFNYTLAWSRFFEETTLEGIFKVNASLIYDDQLYWSLFKYLAMIYEAERAWEPGLTQISTFYSEESDDWIALKKVLVPNIERFNITLEQLKSVINGKFCSMPSSYCYPENHLLELDYGWSGKWECVAGGNISFISMDTICFRLVGYKSYLRSFSTTESIRLNVYDDRKYQEWYHEFTLDLGSESRSTPRRATTRNETYGYYYYRFTGRSGITMDIGIKALYRKLPYVKGNVQCSSDTSREECENRCFRGWIRANCHCSPTTFNLTNISSYRSCTVDDYSICLKKYTENATYLCTNKCVPRCEQWHYDHSLTSINGSSDSYITVSLSTFDYVIIEQVFTWKSLEEFIGALGGVLGIWLGLDFVIIVEFIVKLITKLIKKILLRNVHNPEGDNHRKSVDIRHREENIENGIHIVGHHNKYKGNETVIAGTSIHQINESEKERTSRRRGENNALKEKHVQQREKCSNNDRADSAISNDKMKNTDAYDGRLRNQKVNITDNVDAVQDESTAHADNTTARHWFLQEIIVLFSNGDVPTKKSAMCLRLVEILFWAVIYIVGSIFTTLWCVELISLYLADEAVYYPSLVNNRTVSLPPPSFCIRHDIVQFFEGQDNISNDLMDYFDQSDINRTSFIQISNGMNWPDLLVSFGLLYFAILAVSETAINDVSFSSEYEWQLNLAAQFDTLSRNDIEKSLNDILLPKLLEWNVTANELRQKLGAELARMAELKITFTNSDGTTDIVNETSFYTVAITEDVFCYGLSYVVSFTDPEDALEFSINRALHQQLLTYWGGYITFLDYLIETNSAEFDISQINVAVFGFTSFAFNYGWVTETLISVLSIYTSRPTAKGVKYCSRNMTKSYCRAQCRKELIEKLCNCSPTYWATMIRPTSGLDECTIDRYKGCLNFNASDDLGCKDFCLPFCTASYFKSDSTALSLSQKDNTAIARLSVRDGIYVSIEEKAIFTFSDLLIKVLLDT